MLFSNNLEAEQVVVLVQNLAETHEAEGGNLSDLLAAFAGVVYTRDRRVGHDCIVARFGARFGDSARFGDTFR